MAKSMVKKHRRGCLTGCLVRVLVLLGLVAALFVAACMLGFVQNDAQTGKPVLAFPEGINLPNIQLPQIDLKNLKLPEIDLKDLKLPSLGSLGLSIGMEADGLTIKALHAGSGEALLVCADGYTMLVGAGSGLGVLTTAQTLLCGVNHLNAFVALDNESGNISGARLAMLALRPDVVFYAPAQTKNKTLVGILEAAASSGEQVVAGKIGTSFTLGRAKVTIIGPAQTRHTDERENGLSLRIDYGSTSVVIAGGITSAGETELCSSDAVLKADVLICARGGSDEATCSQFCQAVNPTAAILTGKSPASAVKIRLQRLGASVHSVAESGVITVRSDGKTITVTP